MQHAAESRWQPGRSGGWGEGKWGVVGGDRSVWHMWVAVGGRGGWKDDCRCDCVCWGWYNSSQPP